MKGPFYSTVADMKGLFYSTIAVFYCNAKWRFFALWVWTLLVESFLLLFPWSFSLSNSWVCTCSKLRAYQNLAVFSSWSSHFWIITTLRNQNIIQAELFFKFFHNHLIGTTNCLMNNPSAPWHLYDLLRSDWKHTKKTQKTPHVAGKFPICW